MTKKTSETLLAIVEKIASGVLTQGSAARACDVSQSSYWSWIAQSQRGDPSFVIEYCGEEMPFHKACVLARKIALHEVLGKFEQRMLEGTFEPVFYQGRPQWKEREDLAALDDETVTRVLGLPDRFERDANGNRIQLSIRRDPPVAGVIKVLESNFRQYAQRSEVNVKQKVSGGVTVVPMKSVVPPQAVTVLPSPAPIAIDPSAEISDSDGGNDTDFPGEEPITQLDGGEVASEPKQQQPAEPEAQPVEPPPREEQAAEYVRRKSGPLMPLEQDLLNRLRQRPANAQSFGLVSAGRPEPEDR